ncbi:MAG TPA: glycosyl hydrolase family protein [Terriglobia bacterium]|jgi:hypothetical protein|nr:glycosyl hydrolase family protein [Terriglobia bacterium]
MRTIDGIEEEPRSFVGNSAAAFGWIVLIVSSLIMLSSCGPKVQPVATVSVNTQQLGAEIPRDFLGFSNEVSTAGMGLPAPSEQARGNIRPPSDVPSDAQLAYVLGEPGAPNIGFFTMMKNLGPGVLRLGGNSQDNTCWDPKSAPHPQWCQGPITPGLLKLYSTAVEAAGWRMIIGLNLKQNSPRWALREVTEGISKQIPAGDIIGLEIGNEPSLFARTPARPKTYSPADYVKDASAYIKAFRANPVARQYSFVAPANCCGWNNPDDLDIILKGIGADLKLATVHNYPTTTCGQRNVTVAELLSPERMERFNELSKKLVAVAREHNLPLALAETNSASCGGMAGVSNAFASAVWGLDYMFNIASDGYSNINFHFSYRTGGSAYNPVQTFSWKTGKEVHYRNVAQPLYYAMYAFAKNASGERLLPATTRTTANISAFATTASAGSPVHVFVINKDEKASGPVTVHLPGRTGSATLLMLQAPGLESMADAVRYGGQQFDSDGNIETPSTTSVQGKNGDYTFTLPNASAAVLTVAP